MSGWQILVRDAQRRIVGEVAGEATMEIIDRHLALGSWTITVDAASHDAALLRDNAGIVFVRNGQIAFSGPTRLVEREHNVDDGGHGTLTVSGPCDKGWLTRLVYPNPAVDCVASGTLYSTANYVVAQPAKAETVLRKLVTDHAGPNARPSRQVPGLRLGTDGGRGANTGVKSRFGVLWDEMVDVATRGAVGFDVVQTWDGALEFGVYQPRDQSAAARFSIDLGNLRSYQYTLNPPEATFLVIGDKEGDTQRKFYGIEESDAAWPGLRIEEFLDGTDSGDGQDSLTPAQMAAGRFEEARGKASITFEPIDTDAVVLGRDYRKGDTVTIEIDGIPWSDVVREVRYTRNSDDGEIVTPVIGDDEESPRIYRRFAELRRKVHTMQTRR
ncbi:hypothetical protein BTM25_27110 [Actinomadura rubteroloni]|uniref:Gp28/Gp37-like domain-containing protein n=1 Tax=Actinomadura rubteroloni TaxID=1926885 RepID=A0A2P4UG90_9ACTN|nr:siphovirus ReqiPepy6 Gp37-like family protein [Actinomadura rubteroloni]POM24084.1 hypothetical protein BTM25_27110 [Actinomadura rubteroloni]